jgi:CO/xanthine dehydrogenase FAD-binding subunit
MKVKEVIRGKSISEGNVNAAGAAAIEKAKTLPGERNKWKIQLTRTMVKRAILGCA